MFTADTTDFSRLGFVLGEADKHDIKVIPVPSDVTEYYKNVKNGKERQKNSPVTPAERVRNTALLQ